MNDTEKLILEYVKRIDNRIECFDSRIRNLENWRWFLAGGIVLAGFIIKVVL